jgi:hypothetical protein
MRTLIALLPVGLLVLTTLARAEDAPKPPPFGIKLLPGYVHEPKQGFDSVVGVISKKDGLTIMYEIGRVAKPGGLALGGDFADRPKQLRAEQREWYKEQLLGGKQMHVAMAKDKSLFVSFPESGMNFSVVTKSTDELTDALLMICTYSPGADAK